jgi:hypothetical protein
MVTNPSPPRPCAPSLPMDHPGCWSSQRDERRAAPVCSVRAHANQVQAASRFVFAHLPRDSAEERTRRDPESHQRAPGCAALRWSGVPEGAWPFDAVRPGKPGMQIVVQRHHLSSPSAAPGSRRIRASTGRNHGGGSRPRVWRRSRPVSPFLGRTPGRNRTAIVRGGNTYSRLSASDRARYRCYPQV